MIRPVPGQPESTTNCSLPRYVARVRDDGTEQTVREHLENVGNYAAGFAGKIGLGVLGEAMGLLHDLGKYSDEFQCYLKSVAGMIEPEDDGYVNAVRSKGKIDHSTAGAQWILKNTNRTEPVRQIISQLISLCVVSHHSGLIDCMTPDGTDNFTRRIEKSDERTHFTEATHKLDEKVRIRMVTLLSSDEIKNQLVDLLKTFRKMPSTTTRECTFGLLARYLLSVLLDADRLDAAGRSVRRGSYEWKTLADKLEEHLKGLKSINDVDVIRNSVSRACFDTASKQRGLYLLTVPTGGGKTLASLRFALHHAQQHRMEHILYIIPYTSIIDQNAAVIRAILEESGQDLVVLEHHSNLTQEKDTKQTKILAENWDAPIIFTTAVQLLETLFSSGTRGARRMHQLANSVVIFDEIQTIPIKTVYMFNNAINFLVEQCGSTVVFCTATQPLLNEVNPEKGAAHFTANSEMVPNPRELFDKLRRVEIKDNRKDGGWTVLEVAERAVKEMKASGGVLIVVNTKKAAREVYDECRRRTENVYHLSTNMCPVHRMIKLDEVKRHLDASNPVICVSTQLIEAGVDIDFGTVIRYLAGLDSIAQAAGRCNRHGRRPTGNVIVVNPASEKTGMLTDIRVGKDMAQRVLDEFAKNPAAYGNDLLSPQAMQQYYRYYFFDRQCEMDYPVSSRVIGRDDTILSLLSTNTQSVAEYKNANKKAPALNLRQSFMTAGKAFEAIEAPTAGIIVPYADEGRQIIVEMGAAFALNKRIDLLRKAQRYSVNVFPNMLRQLQDAKCVYEVQKDSGIFWLDQRHYSEEYGISVTEVTGLDFLNA